MIFLSNTNVKNCLAQTFCFDEEVTSNHFAVYEKKGIFHLSKSSKECLQHTCCYNELSGFMCRAKTRKNLLEVLLLANCENPHWFDTSCVFSDLIIVNPDANLIAAIAIQVHTIHNIN